MNSHVSGHEMRHTGRVPYQGCCSHLYTQSLPHVHLT